MLVLCDISAHLALVSGMELYSCSVEEQKAAMAHSQGDKLAVGRLLNSKFHAETKDIWSYLEPADSRMSLLVDKHAKAYKIKNCIVSTSFTAIPTDSLMRIWPARRSQVDNQAIYVTSPSEHFRRAASRLTTSQLLLLGCWLCGTYRPRPDLSSGFLAGQPLCSSYEIQNHLSIHPSRRYRTKAKEASACLISGLASPAEAALFLLLTAPTHLGGYGLPKPEANPCLPLDASANQLLPGQVIVKPDLFWSSVKLDVEYESTEYHNDKISNYERQRMAALMSMGIDVLPVTKQMLYNPAALYSVAKTIAMKLGLRLREPLPSVQDELRETVLGPCTFW